MKMKKTIMTLVFTAIAACFSMAAWTIADAAQSKDSASVAKSEAAQQYPGYTGSSSCRPCHEKFYQLWAPSHHGLAMQPYTPKLGKEKLTPHVEDIEIRGLKYRFVMNNSGAVVTETGPGVDKAYPVLHAMGGKNVFYFLTELERGKLQVLPTAYDLRVDQWYDTAASGVRHFADRSDSPYHWTDYPYTFNTSCFSCHVSQLVNNYDLETDTYNTVWKEPGINCETCHGPAQKHLELAAAHPDGVGVEDWAMPIITPKYGYTAHQTNATCSNCHAKMSPLNANFKPGDEFFQHYDLVTYEHPDYFPDGRDLGENYTYTSWRQSECVRNSDMHCLTCHTSSGRYRFADKKIANNACLPCHASKVNDFTVHTRHRPRTGLTQCIQCHMPMTSFGNMNRSDHSMRPPMPSATIKFGSPNACNMCHTKKNPEWADKHVRKWHKDDYQAETLKLGTWIQQMRQQDYSDLKNILAYIQDKNRDEIFANSMIRLLGTCPDMKKVPAIIYVLKNDPSPLCRASAADGLSGLLSSGPEVINALVDATGDTYRLVRMRAASGLSPLPVDQVPAAKRDRVKAATNEYIAAMMARPDDAAGHFNMGNYHTNKQDVAKAIASFETAIRLRPDFTPAMMNVSMAYNQVGRNDKALAALDKALELEPRAAAVHLNRALLLAEMGNYRESEKAFRATLKYDPGSAVAAYNLAVLVSKSDPKETLSWSRKAYELAPDNPKYAYTAAFYAHQFGYVQEAVGVLSKLVEQNTDYSDAYLFLADIYMRQTQINEAIRIYQMAADNPNLPDAVRQQFRQQITMMRQNGGQPMR
jgi:Tfp pilus assembly protein PilF